MIIFSENFDQVKEAADLEELYGYDGLVDYYGDNPAIIDSSDAFLNVNTSTPLELGDQHKRSLYGFTKLTTTSFSTPLLRDSRRIVFGISIGTSGMRDGLTEVIGAIDLVQPFMLWTRMDILFSNESSALFKVSIFFRQNGTIDITFDNMGAGLPEISPMSGIPINNYRKNFLEIYTDSTGAESGHGNLKIALNGLTIAAREDVVNSNYLAWEGNPSNPVSYYRKVAVTMTYHTLDWQYAYQRNAQQWLIDSFYVCNEEGGVHDDFLGPVHITSMYPDPAQTGDKNNWIGYKNNVQVAEEQKEQYPNASLVNNPALDFTADADDYIQADAELLQELYYMKNNIDPGRIGLNNPIAINFSTFVKQIFSYEGQDFDKGLIAITKPSGNDIDRETGAKIAVDQYTYKPLDIYWPVIPNLAVPWTWELLDGTQFGFESTQIIHQLSLSESMDLSEDVTEE
ncbi:MAG: hypothetical protein H8D87_20205 [Deltaproteobacteria bacterium]|uniref:hypothetical protein n=1 Tax=Desulfobacula sp. TaxID=2593537 RepID=UPI00199F69BB|nr:hypothetical protein [Candidatus Desulfobacula maris]MBL6992279.1 hypothetical protein [Desulfobacula sp.]